MHSLTANICKENEAFNFEIKMKKVCVMCCRYKDINCNSHFPDHIIPISTNQRNILYHVQCKISSKHLSLLPRQSCLVSEKTSLHAKVFS